MRSRLCRLAGAASLAGWLAVAQWAAGQEAVRMSLAAQQAVEARERIAAGLGAYNVKFGDWRLRLQSSLGVEYNDNATYVQTNASADMIFSPSINVLSFWPLTEKNALNLSIGAGYSFYVANPNLSHYFITPGTELSFDVYVKNWVINLHDRLTITDQAYENIAASGNANFGYIENTAGVGGTWDLNKLQVTVGYDHVMRASTTTGFDQQNGSQDLLTASAGFRLNGASIVGVQGSVGLIQFDQNVLSGGVQYSAGLFYSKPLSEHLSVRASAGYFLYMLDQSTNASASATSGDVNAFYASLSLTHRVNAVLSYSVDAGRQVQVGLFSNTLDLYYARLQANWRFMQKTALATHFSYENGTESGGLASKIERYGGGVSLSRALTRKLGASLQYDILSLTSNANGGNYLQNRVLLTLIYSF